MNEVIEANLDRLVRRLGTDVDRDLLRDTLDDAMFEAQSYCNRGGVGIVDGMWTAIRDLAVVRYNRMGNEGESSRSEGSISQNFEAGIPGNIKLLLNPYRIATTKKVRRVKK